MKDSIICGNCANTDQSKMEFIDNGNYIFCKMCKAVTPLYDSFQKFDVTHHNILEEFVIVDDMLLKYNGVKQRVEIPEKVIRISPNAFQFEDLETSDRWYRKNQILEIVLPPQLKEIPDRAFEGLSSLRSIAFPNGLKSIGQSAFENCNSLISADIPTGVSCIGENAFRYCKSLEDIYIPSAISEIKSDTFSNCSISKIIIPENIKHIGSAAFFACSNLQEVTFLNEDIVLDSKSFGECNSLMNVYGYRKKITESDYNDFDSPFYHSKNAKIVREKKFMKKRRCRECGGKFKGIFKRVCSNCGRPKDY